MDMVAEYIIGKMSGERILELGAGEQVWTPRMVARFPHVTTLDGSPDLLESMTARLADTPGATRWAPVHTYFEDYVPEQRFDTVVATYVLEHVTDPALIVRLANTKWLKPGGQLVVAVPHGLSLHRRLAVKMGLASRPDELGETDQRLGHKHCFTYCVTRGFGATRFAAPNTKPDGADDPGRAAEEPPRGNHHSEIGLPAGNVPLS